jgi:hypothetical protein
VESLTPRSENERLLSQAHNPGFFAEYWHFLKESRKWWMLPLLALLLVLGFILALGQTAAAPFIYTLF